MSFCLFVSFAQADVAAARAALRGFRTPDKILLHTPARARDPYLHDGAPPALVVQLYFAELAQLEGRLPQLEKTLGGDALCEAMAVRPFPVPQPGAGRCSYLVAYAGPAQDPGAWHEHYLARHAPLMAELPGIRELEVYTPVEWRKATGAWQPVRSLQRNKVAFDSPEALEAALASPLRAKMRVDFATFPPYRGPVTHSPMVTTDPWQET